MELQMKNVLRDLMVLFSIIIIGFSFSFAQG